MTKAAKEDYAKWYASMRASANYRGMCKHGKEHYYAGMGQNVHFDWSDCVEDEPKMLPLWRCTSCGKWSHAKKKPKRHTKSVVVNDGSDYGPMFDQEPCGPFEDWVSFKVPEDAIGEPVIFFRQPKSPMKWEDLQYK